MPLGDKFDKPQYVGTITATTGRTSFSIDLWNLTGLGFAFWLKTLCEPDWTLESSIWPMTTSFIPDKYWGGNLAESSETTDLSGDFSGECWPILIAEIPLLAGARL